MLPFDQSEILAFIKSSSAPVNKREIARAFGIKGGERRVALKQILKTLEAEETIVKQAGGAYSAPEGLPRVTVIEITQIDVDGDLLARPTDWNEKTQGPPPRIEMAPGAKGHHALKPGDRVLARLARDEDGVYEARSIKRLDEARGRVMGLLRVGKGGNAILEPASKKAKYDFEVPAGDRNGAQDGDLVVGEIQPARGLKRKKVRLVEIIGKADDPKAISLISLHEAGLREGFSESVLKEAEELQRSTLSLNPSPSREREGAKRQGEGEREDLRTIPLVTIDGEDARDFDDAVFAEKTDEGYHLIVAIADVSYYVRPGSALDAEAQARGNSTYFPDRVVPMLPEALSNDLCSLKPDEDRACLAAHLWINNGGTLLRYKFVRGLMRSHARLIYEEVQHYYDAPINPPSLEGRGDDLLKIIRPLYDAYAVLERARQGRGALELDLPERKIIFDDAGNMTGIAQRARLDSHRLIEEFMILANVAAAKALEDKKSPCVYRVHDKPGMDKLDSARDFVGSFGLSLPKGQNIAPKQLNLILLKAKELPYSHLVSEVILRCQSQAVYATHNIGHYGLALARYAHFTSPIRRYADLIVHRALVDAYSLGEGCLEEGEIARMDEICTHISATERTSMEAERAAKDRFTASFLSTKIHAQFTGRITGVTRFGLFVLLDESGADGIVPMRSLEDDFYVHDEKAHALIGRRKGRIYQMGAQVTVRLMEADGLTGSTVLELVGHENGATIPGVSLPRLVHDPQKSGGKRRGRKSGPPRGRKGPHKKAPRRKT